MKLYKSHTHSIKKEISKKFPVYALRPIVVEYRIYMRTC